MNKGMITKKAVLCGELNSRCCFIFSKILIVKIIHKPINIQVKKIFKEIEIELCIIPIIRKTTNIIAKPFFLTMI